MHFHRRELKQRSNISWENKNDMRSLITRTLSIVLVCAAAGTPSTATAQVTTATVSGAVTDIAGAVIPHVKVLATELATGVQTSAETNAQGEYTLPFLKAGTYNVVVDQAGFKTFKDENLALSAGDHPILDVQLQVGETSQTVEVTAEAPLLDSADSNLGMTITTKQVESLPLIGRAPVSFVQYAMGVVATTAPEFVHPYDNSALAGFSVGGLPNKNSEILMDGSPDNASDNSPAYSPPVDAVAEIRMQVFESDAEYGHAGGGVANITTKSGTNRFHGTASEFNYISALEANNVFSKRSNLPVTSYNYNQYGGTIGGPILVPRLFNGRDKLFFFFGYEGIRDSSPQNVSLTVPTAAERAGDFSALLAQGAAYQIYNPFTATTSGGVITRTPIAGNNIAAYLNPVAQTALAFFPQPNQAGNALGVGNYFATSPTGDTYSNEFGRVDWTVSGRNQMYATYRHNNRKQYVEQYFGPANPSLGDFLYRINDGGTIGDVQTFSATTVAELKLNYTRYVQNVIENGDGFNQTSLGLPATLQNSSTRPMFPRFFFANYQNLAATTMTPGLAPFDSYGIFADVVKIAGAHSLKFGVDARKFEKGGITFGNSAGLYNFDSTWTQATCCSTINNNQGLDLAAFAMGLPTSASYDINAHYVGEQSYLALFAQDDWRVRSDFLLNFGLRYDKDLSPFERNGNAVNGFNATAASPISAAAIAAYNANPIAQIPAGSFKVNGGLTFASPSSRDFSSFPSNMFSPRIGFAYTPAQLGGHTSIRGGFGIFVLPVFPFNNTVNQEGFSQTTNSPITTNGYLSPSATLSNPFPSGLVQPTGSSLGLSTFLGQALTYIAPTIKNAYAERWNLDVQRQLPNNWLVEMAYIGNASHRLPITQTPNYVPANYLTTASNPALSNKVANPFAGLLPNGGSLNSSTVAATQLLAVYPEFPVNGITVQNVPAGSSNYNAIEVHTERRAKNGLTLIANYQFSKLLEAVTYLNAFDPRPEYRISQYDHPHHIVVGLTYDLPYGRGRHFGGRSSRLVDIPLGGWTFNSLYFFQSGAPLTFGNLTPIAGVPIAYNARAAYEVTPSTTLPSFNINAFVHGATPTAASNGSQPVNNIRTFPSQYSNLRSDAINDWDTSLLKNFNFTEHTFFQFRFEVVNTINRPQFSAPNLTATSSSFGQITSQANNPRTIQLGGRFVF